MESAFFRCNDEMWFYEQYPRSIHLTGAIVGLNLLYVFHVAIGHVTTATTPLARMCICTILLQRKRDRFGRLAFIAVKLLPSTAPIAM
ncbi:MAG: hypothetical protein ACJASD_000412 [Sphingomonas echinoides]|jgi:hypothetical protein